MRGGLTDPGSPEVRHGHLNSMRFMTNTILNSILYYIVIVYCLMFCLTCPVLLLGM